MKNAFIDAEGVLVSWGYAESNNDDQLVEVDDLFDLAPGKWRYDAGQWVAYTAPPPVPTAAEVLAQRDALLTGAALRIAPLQDAVDLDDATTAEVALLKAWKQYRVALNRIEQQAGFPAMVEWPKAPE